MNNNETIIHLVQGSNHQLTSDKAALGTTFNVFSYDVGWAENGKPSPPKRRAAALRVTPQIQSQESHQIM